MNNLISATPSRRQILAVGAGALAASLPGKQVQAQVKPFRVAHMTDMHVKPEARAGEGWAAALDSLGRLNPAPDILVTGGDHIMDSLLSTRERAVTQWDLYDKVLQAGTKLPVYPVMGNHDVWGWSAKEPMDETAPGYGKAMALDRLKLKQSYYSFDAGGWHFIVLDNVARRNAGYYSDLDPEQLEWLKADLAANRGKLPACVFSHIPFLCVCVFFFNQKPTTFWRVTDNLVFRDPKPLIPLFVENGVKLLVSGHIHLGDRIDYKGLTFICDAAVSGDWWSGPHQEFAEGYGVIDFWPDGSFKHQYMTYGWQAK